MPICEYNLKSLELNYYTKIYIIFYYCGYKKYCIIDQSFLNSYIVYNIFCLLCSKMNSAKVYSFTFSCFLTLFIFFVDGSVHIVRAWLILLVK